MSTDTAAVPAAQPAPAGLNSPPDSMSAIKDSGSDSELSDLEPEVYALDVEPAYISDGNVPVFQPTMDEFADFTRYMTAINKYGMRSGIVKVIPPPEWVAAQPRLDEAIKTVRVKEPIKQDIMGTGGTYRQANIVHQRSYNLPQWRQLCEQSEHQPPAKRGERRANQDKQVRTAPKPKASGKATTIGAKKKGAGRPQKSKSRSGITEQDETSTPDRLPTPVSPKMKAEEDNQSIKMEEDDYDTPTKLKGGRQPKAISVSSRRKNNKRETGIVDEAAFKDFKYELEGEDFSKERCDELERNYWKTLTYAPPLYGADMPGTLFDERTTTWNLGKLENILDVLGSKIPGVNTAYLYLGMWKATFAWHLEDVDLYSINYVHFGAPKQWYSISQGDARRFEAAMKTIWPTDAKACDQFLRHKTFLISPSQLASNFNIKVNKIVAHPGEFVITFPYGYHSGYNLGYNCAEAVNFGMESWLEYGRVAKKCECSEAQDSVWIDVHEIDRKLRGEETEYEETDDEEEEEEEEEESKIIELLTPPESSGGGSKPKIPKRKRKRPTNNNEDKSNAKRIRVRIKGPSKEPCILCPNDIPSEPLLFTEDGQRAHRKCALYIPETSIESGEKETIVDIKYINKARLELKCNYCRSKKGACFQCSQKKCTRAYHATCAAAAGVLVEQGEIPVFGEDGTEYKEWGIEFSCRFHRTKRDKKFDGDALGEDKRLLKAGLELKAGDVCQMQYYRGDIFAGAVVENRTSEEMVLVDILPRGDRVEVEYKWLLIPDPADYHLQKPSAKAIPMPKSFKDKESLNTTKRQVDDLPRADDPFVEGCTWAEFKCENINRNPAQVKVDFSKENQTWFYLGKNSTDAKAQFTEDPAKPRHNPKGHFLDTIPKPTPAVPRKSYAASFPSKPNPNVSSNSHTPIRPSQSSARPSENLNRPDKPYIYKPRNSSEMYSVDQKAYRDQQNFLQRSTPAPYAFGTDPRYRTAEALRPANQHSTEDSSNVNGPQSRTGTVGTGARPAPAMNATRPGSGGGPPPPHSAYRLAAPSMPKPMNPFGSRPQSSSTKPNPFAKYSYLQREHNRSPLEYKSPYRPGGGFMNGYQGSLQAHLQQTMFRPGGSTMNMSSMPSLGGSSRSSNTGSQSASSNTVKVPANNSHRAAGPANPPGPAAVRAPAYSPKPIQTQPVATPATAVPNSQGKPGSSHLHPAIRREYNTMYNHQYLSQQPSPSSVLQPPAMYHRHATPLQAPYQSLSTPQSQARQYPQQPPQPQLKNLHQASQRSQPHCSTTSTASQPTYRETVPQSTTGPPNSQPQYQSSQKARNPPAHLPAAQQYQPSPPKRGTSVQSSTPQNQYQSSPMARNSSVNSPAAQQQQFEPVQAAAASLMNSPASQKQLQSSETERNSAPRSPNSQQQNQTPQTVTSASDRPHVPPQHYQPSPTVAKSHIEPYASHQHYQPSLNTMAQNSPPQYQSLSAIHNLQPPSAHKATSEAQYQHASRASMQESKPVYPHQQYFQQQQVQPQEYHPTPKPPDQNAPVRDPPDVPADSTTLVERMMMALKRAPAA
ncbi:hypothetical protein JHW43_007278 [Diplocarpon mali]|nr:hypothetical protein JHW43_007278 [Diplocarpon mali]